MKVTIDTKEDSHEDIHKVLQILTNILEKKDSSTSSYSSSSYDSNSSSQNVSSNTQNTDTAPLMGMFATPEPTPSANEPVEQIPVTEEKPDSAPDFTSFLNLARGMPEDSEDKNDEPKVEVF